MENFLHESQYWLGMLLALYATYLYFRGDKVEAIYTVLWSILINIWYYN